jgi:RNA polymerase sigma factor (sigma-70 family)
MGWIADRHCPKDDSIMLHEPLMSRNPASNPSTAAAGSPRGAPEPEQGAKGCGCGTAAAAEPDDVALVASCLRGEAKSWEVLVRRYQRLVFTVVRRTGMDEHMAADVFQTVFSRLITHLPRIAEPARLQAWIVTTAKREALLQRRRGERTVSMTDEDDVGGEAREWDVADSAPLAEEALDEMQQMERVRRALERLDARCQSLMGMLFNDEDTPVGYGEMADKLNMAVGSIGPTRARCLDKLRQFLA